MDEKEEKPSVDGMIDANLRKVYESVLNEDVPDRFAKLLAQLESGGGAGPSAPAHAGDVEE